MKVSIPDKLYFKIGEVGKITQVKPYVLRYWESEFNIINPQKSKSNQRVYKKKDVETILEIKRLLYDEKYMISGAKARIKEWLKNDKDSQNDMRFADKKYIKALNAIKDDLYSIRKILA